MNWDITQGYGAARMIGGQTANQIAKGFVSINTSGIRELALELQRLAAIAGDYDLLERHVKAAAKLIEARYKANVHDVTGNLRKSTRTRSKRYPNEGGVIAITGPVQTGNVGSTETQASGNHAWLVEFGSGRRRPGTQGRRTYINVHQMINRRMRRHSTANDEQFARMGRGYYFLMGSKNEPTRQARAGIGYPHDFGFTNGRQHPVTLHPGETYKEMPASNAMQNAITSEQANVYNALKTAIENSLASMKK